MNKFTEKLISTVSGATFTAVCAWIAFSFVEIGFNNFASEWNFLIVLMEVF